MTKLDAQETYSMYFDISSFKNMNEENQATYLADKFITFNKKSSLNILLMCFTYFSAQTRENIFNRFLKLTKMTFDEESSQTKKYMVIGKKFSTLIKFVDYLPSRWSTIYQLARLDESTLTKLVQDEVLHPTATVREILGAVNLKATKSAKLKSKKLKVSISISNQLTESEYQEVVVTLEQLRSRNLIEFDDTFLPTVVQSVMPINMKLVA